MSTASVVQIKKENILPEAVEKALIEGNLGALSVSDRVRYYYSICESMGLNPLTKPFDYIMLNGKLTLYARKDCTDQIRNIHRISIEVRAREKVGDVYLVTARAIAKDGRVDEATGAVNIASLKGDALANAYMKAETKAKRRVTLSLCGLGFPDESELEGIPNAVRVSHDYSPIVNSSATAHPQEEKPAEGIAPYDPDNAKQKDMLIKILTQKNIDSSYFPELSDLLKGKPFRVSEIERVLKEHCI